MGKVIVVDEEVNDAVHVKQKGRTHMLFVRGLSSGRQLAEGRLGAEGEGPPGARIAKKGVVDGDKDKSAQTLTVLACRRPALMVDTANVFIHG